MIHSELLAARDRLNQDNTDLDMQGILEVFDELMHCVVLVDSIERISEHVFHPSMRRSFQEHQQGHFRTRTFI